MRFGTDGVRGRAGVSPIDEDGARRIGLAAARWARDAGPSPRVAVARDPRPGGDDLAAAVIAGCEAAGVRASDLGVLPTAGLMEATAVVSRRGRGAAGVMVTASHNPAHDNGFKVVGPHGVKPDDARARWLEHWLAAPPPAGRAEGIGAQASGRTIWASAVRRSAGDLRALRGRRLVIDLAHGAASVVRDELTEILEGVELVWRGMGDGLINEGVGSEHPEGLARAVRAHGADAGLAVDGDGDRCVLVDETGAVVAGDRMTWILARGLGVRTLAVTVMSSLGLEAQLPGVTVHRTPVGDRHLQALVRRGVPLGAEDSGHVLFRDGLAGGDGLLTGLRALRCAFTAAPTVSGAGAGFRLWPRRLTKAAASHKPPVGEGALAEAAREAREALGGGRVHLRYSGTEPVLRVLVEGEDEAVVERVSRDLTARAEEILA